MAVILGEVIFNLFETKLDFLNEVRTVYIHQDENQNFGKLWLRLDRDEDFYIWVRADGDGTFSLFMVPKGSWFKFEDPYEHAIATGWWDSHSYYSFEEALERLMNK